MARADQTEIRMRIVIEQPVAGVLHSLQDKRNRPLDAKQSPAGQAIVFDFPVRIAAGPKFFGEQVRAEGPQRRFVYVAIGTAAGDMASSWTRRMKIDIHDIPQGLLDAAMAGRVVQGTVNGTGKDGSPACATVRASGWRIA